MATPTAEQIQYMQDHIEETRVPGIHISNGICIGAATISVILRFFARRTGGLGLGKDDYCLFLGYVMYACYVTSFSFSTRFGQGRHVLLVTNVRAFVISNLLDMSFYTWGMTCIKFSILFLYHRIFPSKRFRKALFAIGALVLSWAFSAFFPSVFNCYPIEMAWYHNVKGTCIDYGKVTLIIGIFNIMFDFVLLATPMPLLWKLQMSTRRKVLLSGAFAAGSIACVVSIARLFYAREVVVTYDASWDNVMAGILSGLEMCTGIVACCTITYRPLIEKVFGTAAKDASQPNSSRQGWSKINVRHEISMVSKSRKGGSGRNEDDESMQEWELRTRGVDGNWNR
ncbi:hypothetical protein F4818DRAFT_238049 [Hypoxylon cercidicola]|nr:hypothetical protein F4818DRAFT_238049 [Hypoxylon cercidicola]